MAHLKHPILGDPLYGGALKLPRAASEELVAALRGFRRQALHAEVLEFVHPLSGQPLRCSAPVPEDMLELMRLLREDSAARAETGRSEEHTSELQSLMRISYAVFCLKKKKTRNTRP